MALEIPPHEPCPEHQADSVTIIASPVSGTKYEWKEGATGSGADLGTQKNVRIISIGIFLTWGVTQPTPLEAHITVDGNALVATKVDPVSGTKYAAVERSGYASYSLSDTDYGDRRAFLVEGRNVKVECEITWATTQPTNLTIRVKWGKW